MTQTNVALTAGYFDAVLDFGDGGLGTATFAGDARWLAISVRCPVGSGSYTPLSGRVALNAAPYALSLRPGAVIAGDKSGFTVLTARNTTTSSFGVGFKAETNATQGTALLVESKATGLLQTYGVYATAASRGGTAVYGESKYGGSTADNQAYGGYFKANAFNDVGVYGESAWTQGGGAGVWGKSAAYGGYGVHGVATHSSGENYGVYGETKSPNGSGVYGKAPSTGGNGVYGYSASGHGVHGQANSSDGYGVYGSNSGGIGVYGEGHGQYGVGGFSYGSFGVFGKGLDGGIGVVGEGATTGTKGIATASSGETYGVHGVTSSPNGSGVYGVGGQYGVYGYNIDGTGVYGRSSGGTEETGIGVKGVGTTAGVYGQTGWANAAGGRFKNMWTGYEKADAVGVWAGSYYGDIIQGHELGSDGFSMDQVFRVTRPGDVYIDGTYYDTGADFAEMLPAGEGLEPGDVLVIGPDGQLARSTTAYASAVVGVYSTKPAFVGGSDEEMVNTGKVPLAIVGIVPVKASTENGAIAPGDLLVASSTPAHAMKAGSNPPSGTIIGKALEGLDSGTGVIKMLVTLQ